MTVEVLKSSLEKQPNQWYLETNCWFYAGPIARTGERQLSGSLIRTKDRVNRDFLSLNEFRPIWQYSIYCSEGPWIIQSTTSMSKEPRVSQFTQLNNKLGKQGHRVSLQTTTRGFESQITRASSKRLHIYRDGDSRTALCSPCTETHHCGGLPKSETHCGGYRGRMNDSPAIKKADIGIVWYCGQRCGQGYGWYATARW